MTREEAIARIKDHKIVHKMNEPRAIYISEALDMAIKALSQECVGSTQKHVEHALDMRCEDCISRQAVLDMWRKIICYDRTCPYRDEGRCTETFCDFKLFEYEINHMPPVKPQERTGYWIFEGNQCFSCSSCGRIYTQKAFEYLKLHKDDSDFPNNCPNCGCHMIEEQERSE